MFDLSPISNRQGRCGIRPRHGASGRASRRSSRPLSCLPCSADRSESVTSPVHLSFLLSGFGPNLRGDDLPAFAVVTADFSSPEPLPMRPDASRGALVISRTRMPVRIVSIILPMTSPMSRKPSILFRQPLVSKAT